MLFSCTVIQASLRYKPRLICGFMNYKFFTNFRPQFFNMDNNKKLVWVPHYKNCRNISLLPSTLQCSGVTFQTSSGSSLHQIACTALLLSEGTLSLLSPFYNWKNLKKSVWNAFVVQVIKFQIDVIDKSVHRFGPFRYINVELGQYRNCASASAYK